MTDTKQLNILIIEDNAGDARLLREMLKSANGFRFETTCVDTLSTGLAHLSEKGSDIVLLDLSLPDSFGLDTFETLHQGTPDTPVIIMTGNDDEQMAVKAVRAGAQDYIYKGGMDARSLGRTILYAMERHRLQSELKRANRKILDQQKKVIEDERLKVLLQMAGAASHEMNQPLMTLLGTIELMRIEEPVPEGWDKHMTRIETAGRRIADIIKKMSSIRSVEYKPYAGGESIINLDQTIRILAVEDNEIDFEQIKAHMAHQKRVAIIRAANLAEAKKQLKESQFDVIFLDYILPDGKGEDLLVWMQTEKLEIPVISVTGQGDELIASHLIKSGACDYLPKAAINQDTLSRSIVNALEKFQLKREVAQATQKVVQMATRDALTGLHNRNFMNDTLKTEIERAQRYDNDLACLLIDLDYFKEVNDTFGHRFGDLVLQRVARTIEGNIRKTDYAFRYGGEEFLVLLPQTAIAGAQDIAEKLRTACQTLDIEDGDSRTHVTVSIGIASKRQLILTECKDLLACADKALYQAKAQGRNRVNIYSKDTFLSGAVERFRYLTERLAALSEKARRTSVETMELIARDMGGDRFKAHNQQVVRLLELLGDRMKLQPQVIKTLQRAAVFHDFTKVLLDDFHDQAHLNQQQQQGIKNHPITINQLMEPFDLFTDERSVLLWHHEKWDGSGYPDGLKGEEIPIGARLLAIVDALVAMMSWRPHRKKLTAEGVIRELGMHAGTQFDPSLVVLLLKMMAEEKIMDIPEDLVDRMLEQLKSKGIPK